jgi:hypothetical protein
LNVVATLAATLPAALSVTRATTPQEQTQAGAPKDAAKAVAVEPVVLEAGKPLERAGPVPRIAAASRPVTRTLFSRLGSIRRYRGTLSPRFGESQAATLTRIAAGVFTLAFRVASSLAADFRRARN